MNNLVKIILISVIIFMLLDCSCSCKNLKNEGFSNLSLESLDERIKKLEKDTKNLKKKYYKLLPEFHLHSHPIGLPCTECRSKDHPLCSHVKDPPDCEKL